MSTIIKELRYSTGMTQKQFAKSFDIPVSTLRKWEQGEARPAKYIVKMLTRLLPVANVGLKEINCKNGWKIYYDSTCNSLTDIFGNIIQLRESLDGVKDENLPLYVEDLFEAFYEI